MTESNATIERLSAPSEDFRCDAVPKLNSG